MHTNETGREPTEPTDAGPLLERFERWWAEEGVGTSPNYGQDSDECNRRLAEVAWLNGAYVARELDGQRPIPGSEVSRAEVLRMSTDTLLKAEAERLPDTPAPDEVVRLRAEVVEQSATIARQFELLKGVANVLKGQAGETELWSHADLPEMATRLSARVAELEAELDKARGVFRGATILPFRSTPKVNMDDDMVRVTVDMTRRAWNRVRPIAAPGKEPTSE